MSAENPLGCFSCFCFGKSGRCEQSSMVWTEQHFPSREAYFVIGNTDVKSALGYKIIPQDGKQVGVRSFAELSQPFYWDLPGEILNDQVTSYNGYLRFRTVSRGGGILSETQLKRYPLVILQGNHRLILYHFGPEQKSPTGFYRVKLHESEWKLADNPDYPVTRDVLMVALQKVQHILVRSSDSTEANYVRLDDLTLEVAKMGGFSSKIATGIEQCRCPPQYTSASCQDPNVGYYRKRKPDYLDSKDILDLVGWAEPCNCYNYSRICDKETGECINCEGFTTGPHCNLCLRGYYGDPTRGIPCRKCACPLLTNSFSETCELVAGSNSEYVCTACQEGYTGRHCEQCADGFWGNPLAPNGKCIPCTCSPVGSLSNVCDKLTGQCPCKEGITGHDCSNCPPRHVVTDTGCLNCDDECTGLLLDDVDFLQSIVNEANLTDVANLPWTRLLYLTKNLNRIKDSMNRYKSRVQHGKDMIGNFTINFDLETLIDLLSLKARELARKAPEQAMQALDTLNRAQNTKDAIADLWQMIADIIDKLKKHGFDSNDPLGSELDRRYKESLNILNMLRNKDFKPHSRKGQNELRLALELLERIRNMLTDREHAGPLMDRLKKLSRLLSEIYNEINSNVIPNIRSATVTVNNLRPGVQVIRDEIDNSTRNSEMANATLYEARNLLDLVRQELLDTKLKFASLPDLVDNMMNLTDIIEQRRSILARLNPEYEEKYVKPCMEHAEDLMRRVDELNRLFNQTRDVAESPMHAAKIYETIIKEIEEAEAAVANARDAALKAYNEANPRDGSLLEKAIKARKHSEDLLNQAVELNRRLASLRNDLADKNRLLYEIERLLTIAQRDIDFIRQSLEDLPKDLGKELREVMERLRTLLTTLERTHSTLDKITARIDALKPKLDELSAGTSAGLDNVKGDIENSLRTIQELKDSLSQVESRTAGMDRIKNHLELNLRELKMKIMLARQKAASIRVSIGSDVEGNCMRSFEPDIEPSFTNNIVMYYAIKHENLYDSLLMYLGNSNRTMDDFMAIEMKNRKIRFIWNTGDAERAIEHPLKIQTNDASLSKDSHWYRIEVKRFGNYANLTVQRVPDAMTQDPLEVSDGTNSLSKRMDLDRNSYFYIGSLPSDLNTPRQLQTNTYAGCLYELYLDGKKVGLWNFTSNIGCDGCKEGATEPIGEAFTFMGACFKWTLIIHRSNNVQFLRGVCLCQDDATQKLWAKSKQHGLIPFPYF